MYDILLASTSIGRKASMDKLGLPYNTIDPNVNEAVNPDESAIDLVKRLSIAKARAVKCSPDTIIIAGDQVLEVDQTILCKPLTDEKAVSQLRLCSGKDVFSYSGMCVIHPASDYFHYSLTKVIASYRHLSDSVIKSYIKLDQPLHCAGSIKFESRGFLLLEKLVAEDNFALHGLPLHRLVGVMQELGVNLETLI